MRTMKQNFFWAFVYNTVLIPVAAGGLYPVAGGLVSPILAGVAMALSSVSVASNSLRVRWGRTLAAVALPIKAQAVEVTAVALAPGSHPTVYVATGGEGVFRSEDDGTTWVPATVGLGGLDVRGLAVSPREGRLYAQVSGKG